MTIEQLKEEMLEEEFHQWMAFDLICPIGDNRTDVLIGILCSVKGVLMDLVLMGVQPLDSSLGALGQAVRQEVILDMGLLANVFEAVHNVAIYTAQAILTVGMALDTIADAIPAFANLFTLGLVGPLNDFVGKMHDAHATMEVMHEDLQKQIDASHGGESWGDALVKNLAHRPILDLDDGSKAKAEAQAAIDSKAAREAGEVAKAHEKAAESIDKMMEKLKDEDITFGHTKGEIEIYRLQLAGATDEQLRAATVIQQHLDAQQAAKKAVEDHAKELQKEMGVYERLTNGPMEEYKKQIADLNQLLKEHLITQEQFDKAAEKANEEYDKKTVVKEEKEKSGKGPGSDRTKMEGTGADEIQQSFTVSNPFSNAPGTIANLVEEARKQNELQKLAIAKQQLAIDAIRLLAGKVWPKVRSA